MNKDEFLRALEASLEIDPDTLQVDQSLEDLEFWDSMSALIYMALADEKLQVSVTGDQIMKCQTVGDLVGLLGEKLDG